MNEITKIDKENGILSKGVIYYSAGFGSEKMCAFSKEIFNEPPFSWGGAILRNQTWNGNDITKEYYLTTENAEKWNAHIEDQELLEKPDPLMERAKELAVDGIEILGYGRPEGYEWEEGYEHDHIFTINQKLDAWRSSILHGNDSRCIVFRRKIKEESAPDLSTLTGKQLKAYYRDKWIELLTGEKPKDPIGKKNGTLSSVAKALYGKGGDQ